MRSLAFSTAVLLIGISFAASPRNSVPALITSKKRRDEDPCSEWFVRHVETSLNDLKELDRILKNPKDKPPSCRSDRPHPAVYFTADEAQKIASSLLRIAGPDGVDSRKYPTGIYLRRP